jgi:hypothetical protein
MISYQDKTFCPFYLKCSNGSKCDRALTPEVIGKAIEWMPNPPISTYSSQPECFKPNTNDNTN